MDDASGCLQIRVFPFEAESYGTKAIVEKQPFLVPWQVDVITRGIENETKHLLAQLILPVLPGLPFSRLGSGDPFQAGRSEFFAESCRLVPIVERDNGLAVHIDRDLIPADQALDPLIDDLIALYQRLAIPACHDEGPCPFGRSSTFFIDHENVGVVPEKDVVIRHAPIARMEKRQDPDERRPFGPIEVSVRARGVISGVD